MAHPWFTMRVACHQLRRRLDWALHPRPWAVEHCSAPTDFPAVASEKTSPLKRAPDGAIASYSEEKEQNLRIAARLVDGLLIKPGEVFSFCRTVGKTTRRQGYLPALELLEGQLQPEVGGGLCQMANLLFLLAVEANAEIIERHRHSYDLFRDVGRTVPFGCGATVYYNYIDFQFRNTLPTPLLLQVAVEPPVLRATLRTAEPLPFVASIEETDHHFFRRAGDIYRANKLWRVVQWQDSRPTTRELLFENECRVHYPADDLVPAESEAANG